MLILGRKPGDSILIGDASYGNSKAQISPSLLHTDRNRIVSRGGTRRSAEARLTFAGTLSVRISL